MSDGNIIRVIENELRRVDNERDMLSGMLLASNERHDDVYMVVKDCSGFKYLVDLYDGGMYKYGHLGSPSLILVTDRISIQPPKHQPPNNK